MIILFLPFILLAQSSEIAKGEEALANGKFNDSYTIFESILESYPKNVEAHNGLAKSLDRSGDPQGALMAYHNSLSIDSNKPALWLNIGNLYYNAKDLVNAADAYKKTVELDPKYG